MIRTFADRYTKHISYPLLFLFYFQSILLPLRAAIMAPDIRRSVTPISVRHIGKKINSLKGDKHDLRKSDARVLNGNQKFHSTAKAQLGGPSSPEATSFKAVGSDNLVNLFTGDFSYSIPLLDVGGYPVNLFYSAGITMEQEASWVGLGWNLNPGTVNRNMRGVPDDFNGTDTLIQSQNVKPNKTFGGEVGIDAEIFGMKQPRVNAALGFSYNNYLGPALELDAGISLGIPIMGSTQSEKAVANLNTSLTSKLSSRSGLTFAPSLGVSIPLNDRQADIGVGLSTSYNSRTGVKDLNISSQVSLSRFQEKSKGEPDYSNRVTISRSIGSSTISFARPTYIPTLRMPLEYSNYSGQLELGAGMYGTRVSGQAQGYVSVSRIPEESRKIYKPLVGFIYSENAVNDKNAVMDFNRLNDREVTPNTPIISAPQYAYDIFSIQGEGTGGTIRAFRGDLGYMRDNETTSKDKNFSIGFDIAGPAHFGGNWNTIQSPTRTGGWEDVNNTLRTTMSFQAKQTGQSFENIYFKNPGEVTVTNPVLINRIGGDNLVRFKLSGSDITPRLESKLEQFNKKTLAVKTELQLTDLTPQTRDKRTQVTTMLSAKDAAVIGLEKTIRNYTGFDSLNNIKYGSINRVGGMRKAHHISEIDVLEQSGMRYVYGLPVYSIKQKDFTFSVEGTADQSSGIVTYSSDEPSVNSRHFNDNAKLDGYMMSQETPAYASSFLLTGLLSPDYIDVKNDGITEDDIGGAVKFDYTRSDSIHRWRTPRGSAGNTAHFNEGLKSEKKDNKATISYGEREAWYLSSIESKSMIAIFKTGARDDGKGVIGELNGTINQNENANKKLTQIDLYNKAEIKAVGIENARPVKSVHFVYDYSLCHGTPDNKNGEGKLTLKEVYFTYNGQERAIKNKYVFNYGNLSSASDNPNYAKNASDKWGTYKNPDVNSSTNSAANPSGLYNSDFPYTSQNKTKNDEFAAAWSLKKILLPSGGQMEIQYEADDYAYVQNRRACDMFMIYGLGNTPAASTNNSLYQRGSDDNNYVYIRLAQPLQSTTSPNQKKEIAEKYLEGLNQVAVKLLINMPKGPEALTVYGSIEDYGLCSNSSSRDIIYIKLTPVDGKSPLAKSAIGFITENLPAQAFEGYEIESSGVSAFLDMVGSMLGSLKEAFKNVDQQMRSQGKARTIVLNKSFVRLADPQKMKYGGGIRVKRVLVKDNWDKMKGSFVSTYGQDYEYTTTEKINDVETVISSGVASYEPSVGSEENPFREILSFSNKLPLASAQYGAIEMPVLDGFYQSPVVGYSKVTVRSIHRKGTHGDSAVRSGIGKQVTEFYTARDYPTYSAISPLSQKEYHYNSFFNLLSKQVNDRKVVSQGFLVETNDMHGKLRSQAAYSESDEKTPVSYSLHTYKNTGRNGLNDLVDFVDNEQGGTVIQGNMGIDMELMTDVREFKAETNGLNGQLQTDLLYFFPLVIPVFTMFPIKTYTENKYRAVTTTKLINYHAIEDSVIVMDKGSVISTKTIAFDAETGTPIVSKTANEFNDPVYNINYPAYWAYSGMSSAYKNIGREFSNVTFIDGKIQGTTIDQNASFESGDELYITVPGSTVTNCISTSPNTGRLWAFDKNKNTTALTVVSKDLVFIDSVGNPFTKSGVSFKIIRSGKRNLLTNSVGSVTAMSAPFVSGKLAVTTSGKAVAAGAMEFREKWQADNEVFNKYSVYYSGSSCTLTEAIDCNGDWEKRINPYLKGLLGNFREFRNLVFYGSRNEQSTSANSTAIRTNGYLSDFTHYWNFNSSNNLVPDVSNTKWVWNTRTEKYNSKGLQLESKDALNIYTSAQYGFNNTQPVAVAKNSRYAEMFGEGFEDYNYDERINAVLVNGCAHRHFEVDSSSMEVIRNSDDLGFNAHTGKNVLEVASSLENPIAVSGNSLDDYNLLFGQSNKGDVNESGGNVSYYNPDNQFTITSSLSSGLYINFHEAISAAQTYEEGGFESQQYIKITSSGYYNFNVSHHETTDHNTTFDNSLVAYVKDLDGNIISSGSEDFSAYLCPGIYSLECSGSVKIINTSNWTLQQVDCEFSVTSTGLSTYKSLTSCIASKPIAATDSMMNPLLTLTPGRKMLFSAWVRESCGTPCTKLTYDNSSAQLDFGSGTPVTINPSGPIIDGWQKVEAEFVVPSGITTMTVRLINSNTSSHNYWDDIRIHPFNANMKTYTYDNRTLRLLAELDENNYATFYEYDEEGQLVRVKKETSQGVKTINETRSSKQKQITELQ